MTEVLIPADLLAIGVAWVDTDDEGDWQERAACAETDPEAFFPEKGTSTRPGKRICNNCPVRTDCLDYALARPELHGIWGGKSAMELRKLRAARARLDAPADDHTTGTVDASNGIGSQRLTA